MELPAIGISGVKDFGAGGSGAEVTGAGAWSVGGGRWRCGSQPWRGPGFRRVLGLDGGLYWERSSGGTSSASCQQAAPGRRSRDHWPASMGGRTPRSNLFDLRSAGARPVLARRSRLLRRPRGGRCCSARRRPACPWGEEGSSLARLEAVHSRAGESAGPAHGGRGLPTPLARRGWRALPGEMMSKGGPWRLRSGGRPSGRRARGWAGHRSAQSRSFTSAPEQAVAGPPRSCALRLARPGEASARLLPSLKRGVNPECWRSALRSRRTL